FNEGRENPLGPLSVQYADYAVWQREWLSGDVLAEQLGYWQEQLRGLPPVHNLPLDKTRPNKQSFIGARYCQTLNKGLTEGIQRFCRTRDVTLFMFIHTVLSILLSRYSNENDIVIGTPIAGRVHRDVESLIGFFANTLVLRSDLSGNLIFDELLKKNRQVVLDAYEYQDIPFEIVVERVNPERNVNHSPLFQVMLTHQNNEYSGLELGGLTFSGLCSAHCSTKYDLELSLIENEQGLILDWIYSKDLFEELTIDRFANSFRVLLEDTISSPEKPINQLSILTELQQKQLLIEWNDTVIDYPKSICVPEVFEQQVKRSPDSIAVVFNDVKLSYKDINTRSNQLANYLIKKGVAVGSFVGLCLERSHSLIIAMIGILKAGAVYVPIDKKIPSSRFRKISDEVNFNLLITQEKYLDPLVERDFKCIYWDTFIHHDIDRFSAESPNVSVSSKDLAYVIYTSGSTGQPKGVMIEHASVINLVNSQKRHLDISAKSRMLQFSTISFDAAVFEWMLALLSGASLYICTDDQKYSASLLENFLITQKISHALLPPALLPTLSISNLHTIESLVVGGEPCDALIAQKLAQNLRLFNAYGPTESTVYSTIYHVQPGKGLSIGRPIDNVRLYVLNNERELVPVGVVGQLHIGGAGVARGYLNRPELTK
ncbi:non-ribosomal peptide synthetase, partial [Microbulbifer epialgicus]